MGQSCKFVCDWGDIWWGERTYGRMAVMKAALGSPLPSDDRLCTSWCTAALAIPQPIIPEDTISQKLHIIALWPNKLKIYWNGNAEEFPLKQNMLGSCHCIIYYTCMFVLSPEEIIKTLSANYVLIFNWLLSIV